MNHENFRHNFKALLVTLKISQAELSRKTGISQSNISNYISGERSPSLKSLCSIMKVIPVSFQSLLADPPTKVD